MPDQRLPGNRAHRQQFRQLERRKWPFAVATHGDEPGWFGRHNRGLRPDVGHQHRPGHFARRQAGIQQVAAQIADDDRGLAVGATDLGTLIAGHPIRRQPVHLAATWTGKAHGAVLQRCLGEKGHGAVPQIAMVYPIMPGKSTRQRLFCIGMRCAPGPLPPSVGRARTSSIPRRSRLAIPRRFLPDFDFLRAPSGGDRCGRADLARPCDSARASRFFTCPRETRRGVLAASPSVG